MEHSEECKAEFAKVEQARSEFLEKWPNVCLSCGGWGVTVTQQSVPYGSTTASFDVADPCGNCHDNGKCSRCGGELSQEWFDANSEEDTLPCPHCNWNWGKTEGDTIPELPDWCECFEKEQEKYLKENY